MTNPHPSPRPEGLSEGPDRCEVRVLRYLASCTGKGGFTYGHICRETGLGGDRRTMAITRANVLVPMLKKGWLQPLDDEKPVIFCITDAGRQALSAARAAEKSDG